MIVARWGNMPRMAGFDQTWMARDREGHIGVFRSGKGGAVPIDGFAGSVDVLDALYEVWQQTIAPAMAADADHLAASSGGRYAIAVEDQAAVAAILTGVAFSWTGGGVTIDGAPAAVLIVEEVTEELANRIVALDGYRGSISLDRESFAEELARACHVYGHDYRADATPYRYLRARAPKLEMSASALPIEIAPRLVELDVSFPATEVIDLERLIGAARCVEPSTDRRQSVHQHETHSWWSRLWARR
jgi:hypothetical protein